MHPSNIGIQDYGTNLSRRSAEFMSDSIQGVKSTGPFAGDRGPLHEAFRLFAAEVIKIEDRQGDITGNGAISNDEYDLEKSGTFFYLNTNKRALLERQKQRRIGILNGF